jgi:hypothetical protein
MDDSGSVITMTSDERVQIYVPSPQTTPYNTLHTRSGVAGPVTMGAASLEMVRINIKTDVGAADEITTAVATTTAASVDIPDVAKAVTKSVSNMSSATVVDANGSSEGQQPISLSDIKFVDESSTD